MWRKRSKGERRKRRRQEQTIQNENYTTVLSFNFLEILLHECMLNASHSYF
jgi:hypothetical protein